MATSCNMQQQTDGTAQAISSFKIGTHKTDHTASGMNACFMMCNIIDEQQPKQQDGGSHSRRWRRVCLARWAVVEKQHLLLRRTRMHSSRLVGGTIKNIFFQAGILTSIAATAAATSRASMVRSIMKVQIRKGLSLFGRFFSQFGDKCLLTQYGEDWSSRWKR